MTNDENQAVKIHSLEIENVKRVQAVSFSVKDEGLTLIGGDNRQGKTSILDSIAFALGGSKKKPSNVARDGSLAPPRIKITMSNGLIVERKGKNNNLHVTDPSGQKAGQSLLNSFISELALDLPKFINAKDTEKAKTLLEIIGVGDELAELDHKRSELYDNRTLVGRESTAKKNHAEEMPFYPDLPEVPLSANELLEQHREILAKNSENHSARQNLKSIEDKGNTLSEKVLFKKQQIAEMQSELKALEGEQEELRALYRNAQQSTQDLEDVCTKDIEDKLRDIEDINTKVRANLEKATATSEAKESAKNYEALTNEIKKIDDAKKDLLNNADLPLPELSIDNGVLLYRGQKWDCMSGSEQLIVATAIVRKLKPECGFVLTDKLEQMDSKTLKEFDQWLRAEGLQNIGTIVGDRDECQIIIEDGMITEDRSIKFTKKNNSWDSFS